MVNRSKPGGIIVPSLIYNNVPEAIEWLCRVFGFTERLRAGTGHAQLAFGEGGIMLGQSRREGSVEYRPPRAETISQSLMVEVDDVERHYQHALQHGARILEPPTTYPYGERQYSVLDLEGHRWTFSQAVADANPEDWGATLPKA